MIETDSRIPEALHVAHWTVPHRHRVRFRAVLTWAGLVLLAVAALALMMAGSWRAPDMIFLAGAYGSIGSLTLIASAIHA